MGQEHLLCEVMCLGVRDGAAEALLTGVKVVPETMYLGKSSIGGDIAHIGDWFVFSCVYYIIRFIGISSSTTRRSIWIKLHRLRRSKQIRGAGCGRLRCLPPQHAQTLFSRGA